jgi:aryl-alcohol dehydrogenase-like predicted oxidoreductase
MEQRTLGQDGPKVGAVGFGCMSFAGFYGATTEEQSHTALQRALDLGVTHLDTANAYGGGLSETIIGNFIKDHPGQFSIATKGGIVAKPVRRFDNSKDHLRSELEKSLKRLGVDRVDLYYVHRREAERPIEEVTETLAAFVEEGLIGGIGFSEIAPSSLRRAAAVHPVTAVQSEYSLWTRAPELGLLQTCKELGTAFVAFSPVARGMFADRIPTREDFSEEGFRAANPRFEEPNFSYNREIIQRFNDYAKSQGMHPATMAIAWVLRQGPHIIAIPGTRSPEHLEQNAAAGSQVLSEEHIAEIDRLLPLGFAHGDRYSYKQHFGIERYC